MNLKKISNALFVLAVAFVGGALGAAGVTDAVAAAFQSQDVVGSINLYAGEEDDRNTAIAVGATITLNGETGAITATTITPTGLFSIGAQDTIADSDATPDVSGGSYFITGDVTDTITDFDGTGIAVGQIIFVESDAAITYDVTTSGLTCGDTDVVTADGDSTGWFYDGTDWHCFFFQDLDDNANTWGAA